MGNTFRLPQHLPGIAAWLTRLEGLYFLLLSAVTVHWCAASLVRVAERLTDGTVDDVLGRSRGPFGLFPRANRIKIFLCR